MAENENTNLLGRKTFFLHPAAFVQNQVVTELAQEEYEVYVAKDHAKLRHVLKKNPDSIVFASINEGLKEKEWIDWIHGILSKAETANVDIGILASVNDDAQKRRYMEALKIRCGYTVVRTDLSAVIKQLVTILNAANAKGRRKYIRLLIERETNTTVNLPINGTFVNGVIKDISAVGFACCFDDDPALAKNRLISDIQLRLQSQLLKVEGFVFGSRMDAYEKIYVILFTQKVDQEVKSRIRKYIQTTLQARIDNELK